MSLIYLSSLCAAEKVKGTTRSHPVWSNSHKFCDLLHWGTWPQGGAKSWRKGGGKEAIRPLWGSEAKSSCYHVSVPNFWLTYGTGCIYMTDIARQIHQLQKVSDNILNILKLRQKRGRNALCLGSIPRNLVFIFTVCGWSPASYLILLWLYFLRCQMQLILSKIMDFENVSTCVSAQIL